MRKTFLVVLLILVLAWSVKAFAFPQSPATGQQTSKATAKGQKSTPDGERLFQQNCGRCHNPPDSLSPREVKAVLRHMRVRAMLSEEDEQLIVKYLAP